MSSPEAYTVIHDYLVAQWSATDLLFENEDRADDATPGTFVFVEISGDLYQQASIGAEPVEDNLWRESGQVLAHVMVVRGTGTSTARTYAKQIADLFRGQELSGIRFRDISIGQGEPGELDGSYFAMTTSIDWERDV